jgi:two-component system phosphate regulon sensor histidine kinase PhoR
MSWTKQEKLIHDIYQNQLDAILFSVNQYSDDIISSWANKINIALMNRMPGESDTLQGLDINSIPLLYLSDGQGAERFLRLNADSIPREVMQDWARRFAANERDRIERLQTYFEAGFRKIEPADSLVSGRFVPLVFVLDEDVQTYRFAILFLDVDKFISHNLGPKMQSVAGEKFVISAYRARGSALVYSTADKYGLNNDSIPEVQDVFRKPFWLIPGYQLGIQMKEVSLTQLVNERTRTSVIVLVAVLAMLLAGLVLVYRNILYQVRLSEAKSEFVSNVSHEIRTPLSLISMYAETLEMNRVPESRKHEYYTIISKETARLSGIVNRILNFSKMEANRKVYARALVDVNQLCKEVLHSYSGHLEEKGFKVEFMPAADAGTIEGDREAVAEAFLNLVDNAVKYSRDARIIHIRTGRRETHTYIEVEDHGIGIPRAYQKDIFEQFYRAPMGNVHQTKGSGLGLTIVRKTMEAHHGRVEVESALDKGSIFRLIFPTLITE